MGPEQIPQGLRDALEADAARVGLRSVWTFREATTEDEFRYGTKFGGSFYDQFGRRLSVVGTKDAERFAALLNEAPSPPEPATRPPEAG
jgi:hypothetical protein